MPHETVSFEWEGGFFQNNADACECGCYDETVPEAGMYQLTATVYRTALCSWRVCDTPQGSGFLEFGYLMGQPQTFGVRFDLPYDGSDPVIEISNRNSLCDDDTKYPFLSVPDDLPFPPSDKNTDECIIASSMRPDAYDSTTFQTTYYLRTHDPGARVVSEIVSQTPDFESSDQYNSSYWRLDASGRLLVSAGKGPGQWDNFRSDYTLDASGNIARYELTYGAWTSLLDPPDGRLHLYSEYTGSSKKTVGNSA